MGKKEYQTIPHKQIFYENRQLYEKLHCCLRSCHSCCKQPPFQLVSSHQIKALFLPPKILQLAARMFFRIFSNRAFLVDMKIQIFLNAYFCDILESKHYKKMTSKYNPWIQYTAFIIIHVSRNTHRQCLSISVAMIKY